MRRLKLCETMALFFNSSYYGGKYISLHAHNFTKRPWIHSSRVSLNNQTKNLKLKLLLFYWISCCFRLSKLSLNLGMQKLIYFKSNFCSVEIFGGNNKLIVSEIELQFSFTNLTQSNWSRNVFMGWDGASGITAAYFTCRWKLQA